MIGELEEEEEVGRFSFCGGWRAIGEGNDT